MMIDPDEDPVVLENRGDAEKMLRSVAGGETGCAKNV
jgi:hypothetical protein